MPVTIVRPFPRDWQPWRWLLPGASAAAGAAKTGWQGELERSALKYHIGGAWVAALLNIAFVANDMAVVPDRWERFALVRLCVSACIIAALLGRRRWSIGSAFLLFIPYSLISVENAYMWGFMGPEEFRAHALAYAVLFVGGSMIALWPMRWSLAVVAITILANAWFLSQHTALSLPMIMSGGGNLLITVVLIATLIGNDRYRLARREMILREQLERSTEEARTQRNVIEAAHRDLMASIRYSHDIQRAVLPKTTALTEHAAEHFVLHQAKDVVSGDFHWCMHVNGCTVVAVADCTGHGVPGALMSILGSTLLKKIVADGQELRPAAILDRLRAEVIAALQQTDEEGPRDGMDIALCVIDHQNNVLRFAGAHNPLYRVRAGALEEIVADRMPVGRHFVNAVPFTEHALTLLPGDMFYLCSDGYQDQFGHDERKFGRARLKALFAASAARSIAEQQQHFELALERWRQDRPLIDDVLVLGFRV